MLFHEKSHGYLLRGSGGTITNLAFTSSDGATAANHPRLILEQQQIAQVTGPEVDAAIVKPREKTPQKIGIEDLHLTQRPPGKLLVEHILTLKARDPSPLEAVHGGHSPLLEKETVARKALGIGAPQVRRPKALPAKELEHPLALHFVDLGAKRILLQKRGASEQALDAGFIQAFSGNHRLHQKSEFGQEQLQRGVSAG